MNEKTDSLFVSLHPTMSSASSTNEIQEFFYQKNKLHFTDHINTVLTQHTQNNIRKRITKKNISKFQPQDVQNFLTMDAETKDSLFLEDLPTGQPVVIRDTGWPHTAKAQLLDAIVVEPSSNDLIYVSPYTYDYELGSNKSTILQPDETGLKKTIAVLNEFQVPVFRYQLEKTTNKITDKAINKILYTLLGEDKFLTYTGSQIKSTFDWRFPSRQIIKGVAKTLSEEASTFSLNLEDEVNDLNFLNKVDKILTFDENLLESNDNATSNLEEIMELVA